MTARFRDPGTRAEGVWPRYPESRMDYGGRGARHEGSSDVEACDDPFEGTLCVRYPGPRRSQGLEGRPEDLASPSRAHGSCLRRPACASKCLQHSRRRHDPPWNLRRNRRSPPSLRSRVRIHSPWLVGQSFSATRFARRGISCGCGLFSARSAGQKLIRWATQGKYASTDEAGLAVGHPLELPR